MKLLKIIYCLLFLANSALCEETENYENIFALKELGPNKSPVVLAHNLSTKKLALFVLDKKNSLQKISETTVEKNIWKACSYVEGKEELIAIAFGYGRGQLDTPLSIELFDKNLENKGAIFSFKTERSQTNHLEQISDKLLLNFFDSKYFSKTGFLKKQGTTWEFVELFRKRLATGLSTGEQGIAIARPYGDTQGEDGDVLLFKNNEFTRLPSFRGVRALSFAQVDEDKELEILIGDGWHQNYGELAEARLSLLDKKEKDYDIKTLFTAEKGEFSFEKMESFQVGKKNSILAASEKSIFLLRPKADSAGGWSAQSVYKAEQTSSLLSFVLLKKERDKIKLAVLDGKLKLLEVSVH